MSAGTDGIGAAERDGGRLDERRARFREAVAGLAGRARSAELGRVLVLPGACLLVAGFGLMVLGWWGAAHTHRQIEQVPYLISGGLIGLALVLVGALLLATTVWVTTLRRLAEQQDERTLRRLSELETRLRAEPSATGNGRAARPLSARARAGR